MQLTMGFVIHFVIGILVSFLASVPSGPVNLAVFRASLYNGRTAAAWIAIGGALIEMCYCMLGIWGAHLVPKEGGLTLIIQVLSVPVLLALGIFNLSKAGKHANPDLDTPAPSSKHGFWLGAGLNILNPVLIPFWAFASHWLVSNNFMSDDAQPMILFALGVFIGTFMLLFVVATIAHLKRKTMNPKSLVLVNRVIGLLFIAMASYQGYKLAKIWLVMYG